MTGGKFQPFTDRLSRDIRNDLSESLVTVIAEQSLKPANQAAVRYLARDLLPCYKNYIESRIKRYSRVLGRINNPNDDPLYMGLVLWDEQLFFEVHEILEHAWMKETGEEKLFLQAMIRAAGVYIKLEAGYPAPARKIADKAIPVLIRNSSRLGQYCKVDQLIEALRKLTPSAPTLLT